MTKVPHPDHVHFALHVIGGRDNLTDEQARTSAADFCQALDLLPLSQHAIAVAGYDDDPRELWDVPEARAFVRQFVGWVALLKPGVKIADWQLDQPSLAMCLVCADLGSIVGRNPTTGHYQVRLTKSAT